MDLVGSEAVAVMVVVVVTPQMRRVRRGGGHGGFGGRGGEGLVPSWREGGSLGHWQGGAHISAHSEATLSLSHFSTPFPCTNHLAH